MCAKRGRVHIMIQVIVGQFAAESRIYMCGRMGNGVGDGRLEHTYNDEQIVLENGDDGSEVWVCVNHFQ